MCGASSLFCEKSVYHSVSSPLTVPFILISATFRDLVTDPTVSGGLFLERTLRVWG